MKKKSKAMWTTVAEKMIDITTLHSECERLTLEFKRLLGNFSKAPNASPERLSIYEQMESVSKKLLPVVKNLNNILGVTSGNLSVLEKYLTDKVKDPKKDWTASEKKTLEKYKGLATETREELNDLIKFHSSIPAIVADALEAPMRLKN